MLTKTPSHGCLPVILSGKNKIYLLQEDRSREKIILDDFGLQAMDSHKREYFMEIIEHRHSKRSTIIASQLPVSTWYEVIGEQTIADAILNRMVHNSLRIELKGESLRKKKAEQENLTKNKSKTIFYYFSKTFRPHHYYSF